MEGTMASREEIKRSLEVVGGLLSLFGQDDAVDTINEILRVFDLRDEVSEAKHALYDAAESKSPEVVLNSDQYAALVELFRDLDRLIERLGG
jgi:hypothetical protein